MNVKFISRLMVKLEGINEPIAVFPNTVSWGFYSYMITRYSHTRIRLKSDDYAKFEDFVRSIVVDLEDARIILRILPMDEDFPSNYQIKLYSPYSESSIYERFIVILKKHGIKFIEESDKDDHSMSVRFRNEPTLIIQPTYIAKDYEGNEFVYNDAYGNTNEESEKSGGNPFSFEIDLPWFLDTFSGEKYDNDIIAFIQTKFPSNDYKDTEYISRNFKIEIDRDCSPVRRVLTLDVVQQQYEEPSEYKFNDMKDWFEKYCGMYEEYWRLRNTIDTEYKNKFGKRCYVTPYGGNFYIFVTTEHNGLTKDSTDRIFRESLLMMVEKLDISIHVRINFVPNFAFDIIKKQMKKVAKKNKEYVGIVDKEEE